jgi:hypothetical protein
MPKQQTDIPISIDDNGFLRSPNLHDGFLDGILLAGENRATVLLRTVAGQSFSMQIIGVEALVCNDFRQGNIIFDVQIVSRVVASEDTLGHLFVPPHPDAALEFHDEHKRFLGRQISRIKDGELKLVSIESSYGCNLKALCQDITISSS